MRYFIPSLALLISGSLLFAAEDPALEAAKGQFEKSAGKLDQDLESAKKKHADGMAAAKERLITAFEAAIKRATQKGELEMANELVAAKKQLVQGAAAPAGGDTPAAVPAIGGGAVGESVALAKVDPKKWYRGFLGLYYRFEKGPHPFVNLAVPSKETVWTEGIQSRLRGKIDFTDIAYEGQSTLVIPKDGMYNLDFYVKQVGYLDGKQISPGDIELKKGSYRVKIVARHDNIGVTFMKAVSKATGEEAPFVVRGADIKTFVGQRINGMPVTEMSDQPLVEVKE